MERKVLSVGTKMQLEVNAAMNALVISVVTGGYGSDCVLGYAMNLLSFYV